MTSVLRVSHPTSPEAVQARLEELRDELFRYEHGSLHNQGFYEDGQPTEHVRALRQETTELIARLPRQQPLRRMDLEMRYGRPLPSRNDQVAQPPIVATVTDLPRPQSLPEMIESATRREVANTFGRQRAPEVVERMNRDAFASAGQDPNGEEMGAVLGRFTVLGADQLRDRVSEPDIVEGIIGPLGTLGMINGYRGSMKTLVTLGLAAAIGGGLSEAYGLRVTLHAPVLYAYLEGSSGLSRRLQAWEAHHGRRMEGVHFIHEALNLRQPGDVRAVALLAKSLGVKVIILDSVAKTGGGREDAEDFAAYRAGLEALRDATGAAVLALHNSGLDKTRARGHSTLVDGVDSAVTLIPKALTEGGGVSLKDEKSRDSKALEDFKLRFEAAGPINPVTGESWSGVAVVQDVHDSIRTAMAASEDYTRRVLEAIDSAGGEISPGDLARVLDVPTEKGELAKVMKTVLAGGRVEGNGLGTRAKRYRRAGAGAASD